MSDKEVMEKLLLVLNKIEKRLEKLELKTELEESKPVQAQSEEIEREELRPELSTTKSAGTEDQISSDPVPQGLSDEEIRSRGNWKYVDWGYDGDGERPKGIRLLSDGTPAKVLWTKYLGQMWKLPNDYRISLPFTEVNIDKEVVDEAYLKQLLDLITAIGPKCFTIVDFDDDDRGAVYRLPILLEKYPNCWKRSVEDQLLDEWETDFTGRRRQFDFSTCYKFLEEQNKLQEEPYAITAPWRRYIRLNGLTSSHIKYIPHVFSPNYVRTPRSEFPFIGPNRDLQILMDHHVQASYSNPQVLSWSTYMLNYTRFCHMGFHIVVYMILKVPDNRYLADKFHESAPYLNNESWPSGHLYDEETKILQVAYSIYAEMPFGNGQVLNPNQVRRQRPNFRFSKQVPLPQFWTIVDMQPRFPPLDTVKSEFWDDMNRWDKFTPKRAGETMLHLIYNSMLKALVSWEGLLSYFDELLDNRKVFMKPKNHDNLLVDDESFSRSRKYFWALSCLAEFEICIADNIHQWEGSWQIWEKELQEVDPDNWENIQAMANKIERVVVRLREYRKRFKTHHGNVTALRDGLFNASSVMESRAANQLGENVKLLTFVSVFFLPLAFTTSLWSMNTDLLSITTLSFVIPIIALSTYLVVFNLNSLVSLTRITYIAQRTKLLSKMREDANDTWKGRGKKFDTFGFKPKSEVTKPSEWLISVYMLRMIPNFVVGGVRSIWPIGKKKKVEDASQSTASV